jgi:predicted alpha/beta superfamily hydrolase
LKEHGQVDTASYAPRIDVVSDDFEIPQLNKRRRIWALLPHNYEYSNRRYPVLYLQDAQNLFDEHAPYGNWAIDRHLGNLFRKGIGEIIVIAIDHGGQERIKEYSPYIHRQFGQGQGKHYASFIIETLKPYIDKTYRTLPDREHNGIGGSSMGGLISSYIGLIYPQYFSKLMIFSPSFWFSDKIYFNAFNCDYKYPLRMYIYGGEKESPYMKRHIHRFEDAVKAGENRGVSNEFKIVINPDGEHNERFWSEQFPQAIKWLYHPSKLEH